MQRLENSKDEPNPAPEPPAEWFGERAAPLEIDFGCHRGAFLLGMAALHPGVNFLGIEKQPDRVGKCNARAERLGLANMRAIQGIGSEALASLPERSVSVFHLYFPDPWPKRRHASRRVFQKDFLAAIGRVLKTEGILRLMTDDEPYFREMRELVDGDWIETPWDDGRETVPTAFELTFLKLGKSPFRAALRQQPGR